MSKTFYNKQTIYKHCLIFILFTYPIVALAEQAYITEKFSIDIHSLQNQQGLKITSVSSGALIEILIKDEQYSQIKTQDNKTGWINNRYLTLEKPVSVEYLQLLGKYKSQMQELDVAYDKLSKNRQLEKTAKTANFTRTELNKSKKKIKTLNDELSDNKQKLSEAQNKITTLEKELKGNQPTSVKIEPQQTADLNQIENSNSFLTIDHGPFQVPFMWSGIAMLFSLIIGFVLGMRWLDYRIRKRHGGVRLY